MPASSSTLAERPAVDPHVLRNVLGHFATGVTVMTASANGVRVGVTANSFSSLSLDPPLILWSIVKSSSSFSAFEAASHFAVNILAADQIAISQNFARRNHDKFCGIQVREGLGQCLILPDVCAVMQCETHQIVDGGDHWIIIGRVHDFEASERAPLLFHRGAYSVAHPHPQLGAT